MTRLFSLRHPLAGAAAFAAALLLCTGTAMAQTPDRSGSTAHCDGVQQDRAACLREAAAARQEARRGTEGSGPGAATLDANALARCQAQPPAERADCEARIRGTGSTSNSGSVMGGGVIRETVTPVPAAPAPAR